MSIFFIISYFPYKLKISPKEADFPPDIMRANSFAANGVSDIFPFCQENHEDLKSGLIMTFIFKVNIVQG